MNETLKERLKRIRERSKELFSDGPHEDEPQSVGDPKKIFEEEADDREPQNCTKQL